jgi:glycosyltransferase involved in cell wall biosynthesis
MKVLQVGLSGFPQGTAAVNRCIAINKMLVNNGIDVLVINRSAVHENKSGVNVESVGVIDGVRYQYTTPTPYRQGSFVVRRWYKFIGRLNEAILLIKYKKNRKVDLLIYYPNGNFLDLLYYRMISFIIGAPLVTHYVEYRSAHNSRDSQLLKLNDKIFDNYFHLFVDGVIPISIFLENQLIRKKCGSPMIRIPSVFDYSSNTIKNMSKLIETNPYFLYCGSIGYKNAIRLIINSFAGLKDNCYDLYLVLNGNGYFYNEINQLLEKLLIKDRVKIYSGVDYNVLLNFYKNAEALLIPLEDNVRDIARVPQKISEYLASGSPIITNNVGDVKYYFTDQDNALIAISFTEDDYRRKMQFVIDNHQESKEIGLKGYEIGLNHFSISSYSEQFSLFVRNLINK